MTPTGAVSVTCYHKDVLGLALAPGVSAGAKLTGLPGRRRSG